MNNQRRVLVPILFLLFVAGCATPPGRRSVVSDMNAADRGRAAAAYESLLVAERAGDAAATYKAGLALVDNYPGAEHEDHALLITARAARQLEDRRAEERLLGVLVRSHPRSEYAHEAWFDLAGIERDRGRWPAEADALVRFDAAAPPGDARREGARSRIMDLLRDDLRIEEIDEILDAHRNSAVSSTGTWIAARRSFEEGRDPQATAARLESFLTEYPRSRYADDARSILAQLGRLYDLDADPDLSVARTDRIGIVAPLTGEYASLGQAMFDGAMLAVEEHNRSTGSSLSLVSRDSRGDEVVAVLGARELIEDEQSIAIIGALLSSTTVAVATLCEERGVPLVSPTATKETIREIGPYVFQTNLTKDRETGLLVRVAVRGMMRDRFAILYPATEEGVSIADRFAAELERQGGQVVARASYDLEVTDFAVPMIELRRAAPEALFVPATANEMRLIAPQLTFHDLRAQLFGLSSWNNSLLLREAGASMEQAVMPSEVALIPEERRLRFEELWRRRFPSTSSTPIALKTYMAALTVIEALDPEGGDTRQRLRVRLEEGFVEVEAAGGEDSAAPLRVVRNGQIVGLPVALFPGLAAPARPDDELMPELLEDELIEDAGEGAGHPEE